MTDWERVEKLRAKGLSWDEIAEDENVNFSPPPGSGSPGLALKSLYFQRRSRRQRQARSGVAAEKAKSANAEGGKKKRDVPTLLAFIGFCVALGAAVPFALSFGVSLVTVFVGAIDLAIVAAVGAVLLGIAYVWVGSKALRNWPRNLAVGVVVGILAVGVLAVSSFVAGCPVLATSTTAEPSSNGGADWVYAANPLWESGGKPVYMFLGSQACPYCSASSWAIEGALRNFSSSVSNIQWGQSNPSDVYPQTPEIEMCNSQASSSAISWDPHEGCYNLAIQVPSPSCPDSAYVSTYDSGGSIPFLVLGGQFIHVGTIVNPQNLEDSSGTALPPSTVASDIASQSGVWSSIGPEQYWIEAYLEKCVVEAGGTVPSAVLSNSQVQTDYDSIQT